MNILLIHQYFLDKGESGGSRFNEMTKVWREQGHNVTVLAGMIAGMTENTLKKEKYKGKFVLKEINDDGVVIYRCHVSEAYNLNFLGRLWAYISFVFSSIWAGIFKAKDKYDVVLVTSPPLFVGITGLILKWIKGIPLVFEIRDLWPESAIDTGVLTNKMIIKFAYWFEAYVYKKASLINTLTPAFQKKLVQNKGISSDKVIMIPNASDFSLSERLLATFDSQIFRKEMNWEDKFVITYMGAHGIANHLIQVIDTASLLTDTNAHFVLIGDGMQKASLIEEVEKRGLKNVQFISSVPKEEVFKYILASDMGTSVLKKVDTFKTIYSNKTFDYMSCKKPILMVIDGVSRELVEVANCGVYIEPENHQDFNEKVRFYLQNSELAKQQGENGYLYAKQNFDRHLLATKYLEHLKNLSQKR